jgi:hypothetical protein
MMRNAFDACFKAVTFDFSLTQKMENPPYEGIKLRVCHRRMKEIPAWEI